MIYFDLCFILVIQDRSLLLRIIKSCRFEWTEYFVRVKITRRYVDVVVIVVAVAIVVVIMICASIIIIECYRIKKYCYCGLLCRHCNYQFGIDGQRERNGNKEFCQFLGIANGSPYELQTQLIISNNLNLINTITLESLLNQIDEIQKMNYKLQLSLKY